jgi:hypothetical protein
MPESTVFRAEQKKFDLLKISYDNWKTAILFLQSETQ